MDIVVAGAGSWGTALAWVLGQGQHRVTLWGRDPEQIADMTVRLNDRQTALTAQYSQMAVTLQMLQYDYNLSLNLFS